MARTPRLGKGLDAIIGTRRAAGGSTEPAGESDPTRSPSGRPATRPTALRPGAADRDAAAKREGAVTVVRSLPVDKVIPNTHQPREDFDDSALDQLAASIKANGLVQPIVVRGKDDGRYELIAGERRLRATKRAGLDSIQAIVREASDKESLHLALIENLQREDLNPIERAGAYQQYIDVFGSTPDKLAGRLGESRASIVNYTRLLRFGPEIRDLIASGELGMGQARAILGIEDPQQRMTIAKRAVRQYLSAREVETLVRQKNAGESEEKDTAADAHASDVERALGKALGLPVKLYAGRRKNSGRIVIRYNSLEEFDRLAERITGGSSLE